jgi:hypothetical protein
MKSVRVQSLGHLEWKKDSPALSVKHPLGRRFSNLQKCVVKHAENISDFSNFISNAESIFYLTRHGEGNTSLHLLHQTKSKAFPLSPQLFQHSVHNCAASYLTQIFEVGTPICTITGSGALYDSGLNYIYQLLAQNQFNRILLILADEWCDDLREAQTEFLFLDTPSYITAELSNPHKKSIYYLECLRLPNITPSQVPEVLRTKGMVLEDFNIVMDNCSEYMLSAQELLKISSFNKGNRIRSVFCHAQHSTFTSIWTIM